MRGNGIERKIIRERKRENRWRKQSAVVKVKAQIQESKIRPLWMAEVKTCTIFQTGRF